MSYKLGKTSKKRLATCHNDIQTFVNWAIKDAPIDFSVVAGQRGRKEQEAAFKAGNSKARYGESPHNAEPKSLAVDLVPWIDGALAWDDDGAFERLEEHFREVEKNLIAAGKISVTFDWGGDWPGAWDKPHWQITGWRKRV